ncbi:MAG: Trehalose-6-phosphate phosphatase [Rhodanobacteraceae bacterium]|nr:MAG: Trehalose-6-phosphate phosphatase [Rhodanobacteraceae bacterium]
MSTVSADIATDLPAPPGTGADAGWALFLDVDGTLLDIARHPDDVHVDPRLHADLGRLRASLDGAVALLSGRTLSQLDALFDWNHHAAAGLHGAELRTPDGRERITGDGRLFSQVRARAHELVGATQDVMLEDKRLALALHYRHAPHAREAAERIAQTLLREAGDRYALQRGDHVFELKPAGVDKGRALAELMRVTPFRGRTPWMLGDDLTDEDAFRRVNAHGGVSVIVGSRRPTLARHALADPAAVRAWLHALAEAQR